MTVVDVWLCAPLPVADVSVLLTADELAEAALLQHEDDRRRAATGRALLRAVVAARAEVPTASVHFTRRCGSCGGPHGKPHPDGLDVHVSLSHAGHAVTVAAASRPVGVDVEQAHAAQFPGFADVAFTPRERARVAGSSRCDAVIDSSSGALEHPSARVDHRKQAGADADRLPTASAIALWVRKEALLKVRGVGLARDPRSVELGPSLGRDTVVDDPHGPVGIADLDLSAHAPGYVGAVAVAGHEMARVRLRGVASPWDVEAPAARTTRI